MSLPLFYFKNLSLSFGEKTLFNNINAQVSAKEIICLIGKNGSGKTTLLKLMAQKLEADKGEVFYQPNIRIGYLPQQPDITEDMTCIEYVMKTLHTSVDEMVEDKKYLAEIILDKLKLPTDIMLSKLSGGNLRRADLAKILVQETDLLFLDEPTNHLDIPTIEWLETYLKSYSGAVVVVSHDRRFLKNISNRTIWLDRGKLQYNNRGYADFDRWSEDLIIQEERELIKLGKELDKENIWLQQGVTARRKRNQQRLAALHSLREKLKTDKSRYNSINSSVKIDIQSLDNKAKLLAAVEDVSLSFASNNINKTILKNFSLNILKGETIGVMGENGAGKSSFIKLLTKDLKPTSGIIHFGNNLKYGYIDQNRTELNPEKTLWETLCPNGGDTIFLGDRPKHVVAYLKDFLFDSKQATSKISTLSGGEKNRLLLAKLLINPGNFLILDEPTNDLDVDTLDMLVEILSDYKGTLLIVSHDRDFLERLVTRTIIIEDHVVYDFIGGYEDYLKLRKPKQKEQIKTITNKPQREKNSTKLSYKDERELSLLPDIIDKILLEINALEKEFDDHELFNTNPDKFNKITQSLISKKLDLEKAENRWLELEELNQNISQFSKF